MTTLSRILVVNTGSSSVKLSVIEDSAPSHTGATRTRLQTGHGRKVSHGALELGDGAERSRMQQFTRSVGPVDAIAVRIVHGGTLAIPSVVDSEIIALIEDHIELAPLHDAAALACIRALQASMPTTPIVACPDRWFHRTIPAAAATYAIPWEWTNRYGLRRIGFHGFSHAYAARRIAELAEPEAIRRTVVAHLGSGASLCAVLEGLSVDTTMGFTPLDGLMMGTRSGSLDPGIPLWMARHVGLGSDAIDEALNHRSGLLGVSGVSARFEEVQLAAKDGNERARLACEMYAHRVISGIASMAASLGGINALVFTGGVGENNPRLRSIVTEQLAFLGLTLDPIANCSEGDRRISTIGSASSVFVVASREDLEIAQAAADVMSLVQ